MPREYVFALTDHGHLEELFGTYTAAEDYLVARGYEQVRVNPREASYIDTDYKFQGNGRDLLLTKWRLLK